MRPERVLVLGCGSVAQCTLPLLIRDLEIEPARITIVDMLDNRARIADSIARGSRLPTTGMKRLFRKYARNSISRNCLNKSRASRRE